MKSDLTMTPIEFPEVTHRFTSPDCFPLPAHYGSGVHGEVVSCWKLSVWQRIKLLWSGAVWHSQRTHGKPPMPVLLTTNKWEIFAKQASK